MFYEPDKRDRTVLRYDPFKAIVAPRPIGWISSIDAQGRVNLAPYSFGVHIDDRFIKDGLLDTAAMKPIARCGYDDYTTVEAVFSMLRPAT